MGFGECITRFGKVCTRMFLKVGTFKEGTGKVTKVLLMVGSYALFWKTNDQTMYALAVLLTT